MRSPAIAVSVSAHMAGVGDGQGNIPRPSGAQVRRHDGDAGASRVLPDKTNAQAGTRADRPGGSTTYCDRYPPDGLTPRATMMPCLAARTFPVSKRARLPDTGDELPRDFQACGTLNHGGSGSVFLVVSEASGSAAARSGVLILARNPMPSLNRPSRKGVRCGYWP
jgi:hypothetical protein